MNKPKLLSLLGLMRKAGKLVYGFDSSVEALKNKKAVCLLYASDISEKTEKNLKFEALKYGTDILKLEITIDEASLAIGKKAGVFALSDAGFMKALVELTAKNEN
ncbi:MAG: 50S ribosomal protein L7ae [Ruminococcaceae bacterium]|nr:50S ribosomal protein L7ae [Oscillospiraceae bacterium]